MSLPSRNSRASTDRSESSWRRTRRLCSNHIFLAGNEAQKKKYVSKLATGEFIGAWGLTEPSSGSDAGSARMTAVRKGNNWVLNGTKTFCTNGHYADVSSCSR